jgi:hypothetical protein
MLAAIRFLWSSTRGHRFAPWRSEYLKWRIETYTGRKAETIGRSEFFHFLWQERRQFLRFLVWTGDFSARTKLRS